MEEIKKILIEIKEELERLNDLKEVELGIKYACDYKAERYNHEEAKKKRKRSL